MYFIRVWFFWILLVSFERFIIFCLIFVIEFGFKLIYIGYLRFFFKRLYFDLLI